MPQAYEKTSFITNNCRLKEPGQKKYLSPRLSYVFLITSFSYRLAHNVFLTTSFSLCLSHNVSLTTSFTQPLSHTVALTYSSSQRHNIQTPCTRNLSMLYKYPKMSQISLSSDPRNFNIFWSMKLKPRRLTSAIYIL